MIIGKEFEKIELVSSLKKLEEGKQAIASELLVLANKDEFYCELKKMEAKRNKAIETLTNVVEEDMCRL